MSTPAKKKLGNLFEIGRQVDLPLSKIGDIAWRNMKHRFGRSIVTTSGVILATAFLMAMLIKNSMVGSMLQATRSLKSVQLDQPLSARQAHDIVTVLNDQHQGFDQTLQDYTDVLTDNKNSLKVQKAVVQQCIADLKDCSLSPGKAKPGQELAFHQKTEQLLQAKNDLQSDETSLAAQQEQVDIAQAVVDRANRLLKTAAPGYVFSAKANAPGAGSATEDVEFLHRQGNMLEHELQSRAIQDEGTAPAAAAAAA
ncbi:MAG: hypothetical protein ACREJ2_01425, partial [Planctomycetota bacterium]